ncbi:hypothetical protein HZB07_07450 [Candidatus Saganbacteria bacterium]|nr:hypothetical protein [Candidatus Saganbacteria bacterium]
MIDYLIQNFNWPTFFIALGVFALISNIVNLINAIVREKKAKGQLQTVEKKYQELQDQLKNNQKEYDRVLGKKEP